MKQLPLYIVTFILILLVKHSSAQSVYYQDVFHGEVSHIGFSSGDGAGSVTLPTNLANGSSVRKVFLICYGIKGHHFIPTFRRFAIDGVQLRLDSLQPSELLVGNNNVIPSPTDYNGHVTYVKDLTEYIQTINSNTTIDWIFTDTFPPPNCPGCNISSPLLVVLHENSTLPAINVSIVLNNQDNSDTITMNTSGINPADSGFPIALGIQSDRLGGGPNDGYNFEVNSIPAGTIRSQDNFSNSLLYGAFGCYHYGNHVLTALTDDNADPLFNGPAETSNFADGLIELNTYITNSISPLEFKFSYTGSSQNSHNYFISYTITHTTPCQPQNVSVSNDTILCLGDTLQLSATGGVTYEWQPQKDLSCYTCANPLFTGDSSQLYTVRISANDSCSVVRPVMIHVRQIPAVASVDLNPTICGAASGMVNLTVENPDLVLGYSLNSGLNQSSGYFNNVPEGLHVITIQDTMGCLFDTIVSVGSYLTVDANFTVSPASGVAPLAVLVNNQSTNADDYFWSINGSAQNNPFSGFQADSAGNYTVQLVAWQNDSSCADTSYQTISVSATGFFIVGSSLIVSDGGVQSTFLVHTNGKPIIDIELFDDQGRILKRKQHVQLAPGSNTIWSKEEMDLLSAEMCFYRINWSTPDSIGELKSKVMLLR